MELKAIWQYIETQDRRKEGFISPGEGREGRRSKEGKKSWTFWGFCENNILLAYPVPTWRMNTKLSPWSVVNQILGRGSISLQKRRCDKLNVQVFRIWKTKGPSHSLHPWQSRDCSWQTDYHTQLPSHQWERLWLQHRRVDWWEWRGY